MIMDCLTSDGHTSIISRQDNLCLSVGVVVSRSPSGFTRVMPLSRTECPRGGNFVKEVCTGQDWTEGVYDEIVKFDNADLLGLN